MEGAPQVRCPCCHALWSGDVVYEHRNIPIHSCLLVSTREEALRFPTGDLRLAFCRACGFVWNVAFQPEVMRYASSYEETQAFSPRFRIFQTGLIEKWIDRYGLRNRSVLEIGCGKGDFILELCELGKNTGIGIDPTFRADRHPGRSDAQVTFLPELYRDEHTGLACDFICCRHTLEHIHDTHAFLQMVRRHAERNPKAIVCFEVPDIRRIFQEQAFWDLYYEHCSNFSAGSLARLLRSARFEILDLYRDYDDQYLIIETRPTDQTEPPPHRAEDTVEDLACLIGDFEERIQPRLHEWETFVQRHRAEGRHIALWGSGSKAVTFLNRFGFRSEICGVVDVNPHKHGKFLAVSGHEILSPVQLRELNPDVVIAMNPVYREEIGAELERLHLDVELVSL